MDRDHIKIVEFGMDDESPAPTASERLGGIKIFEFGNDWKDSAPRFVTGKDVGKIKIVEFDNDRPPRKPEEPVARKNKIGPVKVVEFDKEQGAHDFTTAAPKIKILEFD